MAYTLKLNIFRFSLYRILNTYTRPMRGKVITKYETEKNTTSFGDFIKVVEPSATRDDYMKVLFQKMISHFDNKFKKGDEGNKAVAVTKQEKVDFGSNEYTIWGMFKGGETDIERKVYSQDNATKDVKVIGKKDVPAVNYFYKIWMPYDGDDGILIIQSYTDMGCVASFKDQIEKLFVSLQYRPMWNSMIPKGFVENYLKTSFIHEIKIEYDSKKEKGHGLFASLKQVKKNIVLSRLSISLRELFKLANYREELKTQIENIVDFDSTKDKVIVFYKDENGKEAHATMGNLEEAMPTIILPDSLKEEKSDIADPEKMNTYTSKMLQDIKEQIDYKPKKIQ